MLRRLCALLLMLTCAIAPVLPVHGEVAPEASCCGQGACACNHDATCVPPPAMPSGIMAQPAAALEQRVAAAKPAARAVLAAWTRLQSLLDSEAALPVRPTWTTSVAAAAPVALFEAHCSLLL